MRQILPHPLWIGHAGDGRNDRQTLDAGIRAIVQLAIEEPALQPPRELLYCRFPLVDGQENDRKTLYLAVVTLVNLLEKSIPVLVCCGDGMSRSPAVAAVAVALVHQEKPEDCLVQIAEHQPHDVAPGFWLDVKGVFDSMCS